MKSVIPRISRIMQVGHLSDKRMGTHSCWFYNNFWRLWRV